MELTIIFYLLNDLCDLKALLV